MLTCTICGSYINQEDRLNQFHRVVWCEPHKNPLLIGPNPVYGDVCSKQCADTFQRVRGNVRNLSRYARVKRRLHLVSAICNID